MKIAIANDHAGVEYKKLLCEHLEKQGHEIINFGTDEDLSCDYPDYAQKVCKCLQNKQADFGVLICGTGVGMSIAANKHKGIRASLCQSVFVAEMTRKHNDSNVLCLGARVISEELMYDIADAYFKTPFDEAELPDKHTRRINKTEKI